MAVRISVMTLRICGVLALLIGILYWIQVLQGRIIDFHMMLGIISTLALWALGYFMLTAPKGANLGMAIGAFILGAVVIAVGISQLMIPVTGTSQLLLRILHLLLGLSMIGMGEAIAGRYRRANAAVQSAQQRQ